jgi:hypothetical protein
MGEELWHSDRFLGNAGAHGTSGTSGGGSGGGSGSGGGKGSGAFAYGRAPPDDSTFAAQQGAEAWARHVQQAQGTVAYLQWPQYDEAMCEDDTVTVAVQVMYTRWCSRKCSRRAGRCCRLRRAASATWLS